LLREEFLILLIEALIFNKQAHIINRNIPVRTKETNDVTASGEQSQPGSNYRRQHFMNYCITHLGKFSCPVDCFLELNYAIFKDFIRDVKRSEFFEVLLGACCELEN